MRSSPFQHATLIDQRAPASMRRTAKASGSHGFEPLGRSLMNGSARPPSGGGGLAPDLSCLSEHVIFWVWAYNSKGRRSVFKHVILSNVLPAPGVRIAFS